MARRLPQRRTRLAARTSTGVGAPTLDVAEIDARGGMFCCEPWRMMDAMTDNAQPDPQQPTQAVPASAEAQPEAQPQPQPQPQPAPGYYGAVPPGGFYGGQQAEAEPPEGWQAAYHKAKKRSNIFLISTVVLAVTTVLAGISALGLGIAAIAANNNSGPGYSRMDGRMPNGGDMFGDDGDDYGYRDGNGNGNGMRQRPRTAEPTPSATASVPSATPSATASPSVTATP